MTSANSSTPQTPKRDLVYATVQHYEVMYTTDLTKSSNNRIWHDGSLTLHLLNGRIQLSNLKEQKLVESWFHSSVPQRPNAPCLSKQLQKAIPLSDKEGNKNQREPLLRDGLEIQLEEAHLVEIVSFKRVSKVDVTFLSEPRLNRKISETSSSSSSIQTSNSNTNSNPSPGIRNQQSTPISRGHFNKSVRAMSMRPPSENGESSSSIILESSFNTNTNGNHNDSNTNINTPKRTLLPFKTPSKRSLDSPSLLGCSSRSGSGFGNEDNSNKKTRLNSSSSVRGGGLPRLGLVGRNVISSLKKPSEESLKKAREMAMECEKPSPLNNNNNKRSGIINDSDR